MYAIPKLTLYPILLLAFGLGPVRQGRLRRAARRRFRSSCSRSAAVRNTKPILLKTGHVLKLSRPQMVRWILFPAAIPEIFTGLRVGFSLTLIGSLLAEMFASQRGLGYLLMNGIGLHNVELIMSVTLLIVVFAAAVSTLLLQIDRRLHRRVSACGRQRAMSSLALPVQEYQCDTSGKRVVYRETRGGHGAHVRSGAADA